MHFQRHLSQCLLVVGVFVIASPARSEPEPPAAPAAAPTSRAAAAREHYARGRELYARREYARALVEFERAHAFVPSPKLLFSMGQTHTGLEHYAEASLALRAYLDSVGGSVPAERRAQVERQLEALRAKIGTLDVTVNTPGARINIDGEDAGTSPLPRPVVLDAGRHRIAATLAGHSPAATRVSVTAGTLTHVRLDLQPQEAPLASRLAAPLWVATGVFATLTVGSALIARGHQLDYERSLAQPHAGDPASASSELQQQRTRIENWLIATDVLAAATLVSGGTAFYFSLRPAHTAAPSGAADVFASVSGRFQAARYRRTRVTALT